MDRTRMQTCLDKCLAIGRALAGDLDGFSISAVHGAIAIARTYGSG